MFYKLYQIDLLFSKFIFSFFIDEVHECFRIPYFFFEPAKRYVGGPGLVPFVVFQSDFFYDFPYALSYLQQSIMIKALEQSSFSAENNPVELDIEFRHAL